MRKVVAALCILAFSALARAAEDVSRVPPRQYTERLAALLTPSDEALKHRADKAAQDDAASSLVTETARYVDDSGRVWIAVHQIDWAHNDQGVEHVARTVLPFRRSDQKPYVVLARSIQADGSATAVADNAVLVQTPQSEGDASVYSDQAQLVLVFPNVKAGAACESIIVLEESAPQIPGEFTAQLRFSSNWYHWKRRNLVEMSRAMAERLTIAPLGAVPAQPKRQTLADGSVTLDWQMQRVSGTDTELDAPPDDQTGPIVYLSTLKSWDALADWYRTLLKGRDAAGKELARQVADRTGGMTDRDAIIKALLEDASRDVRYTGMEFGVSGIQPYDPNTVWANRYGDCKDKANLLRVMLRAREIPADLVLVNTEHAGRIEKQTPDVHQFDHKMVAVEKPGGYTFCDPTITYARPGVLRPDDMDREVLVIKDHGAQFVHTPAGSIGNLRYDFDLKLAADGSLSGWLTLQTDGYVASSQADYYWQKDRTARLQRAAGLVQDFYPKADVVDIDAMPAEKFDRTYKLRAYLTVPAPQKKGSGPQAGTALAFPGGDTVVPDLGDQKTRKTDYWQSRRHAVVRQKIALPAGWAPTDLPHPFGVETAAASASASWGMAGGAVVSSLDFRTLSGLVPPDQYALMYNATSSLRSWMDKPLQVAAGAKKPARPSVPQPALADFPLMPSGEGQLDLVEKKYPDDGDLVLRREALQRVLQWFPSNRQTQFIASVRLLIMDHDARPKDAASIDRIRQLLAGDNKSIDQDYVTWAQYLLALWLKDEGQSDEAMALFMKMATDPQVNDYRRAWSSYRAAQFLASSDPKKAIAVLDGAIDIHSDALPYQFSELALLLLEQKRADGLQNRLDALAERSTDDLDQVATALANDAKSYVAQDPPRDIAAAMLDVLEKLIAKQPSLAHLREQVGTTRQRVVGRGAYAGAETALKDYLAGYHPDWWKDVKLDPSLKTRESFKAAVLREYDNGTVNSFARYTLEYLTRFSPDPADFGERTWRLVSSLNYHKREPQLVNALLSALDKLPETDKWRWEGVLTRGKNMAASGDPNGAIELLRPLGDNPKVFRPIRWATYRYCGEYFERLHRYDEALASYNRIESDPGAYDESCEGLLRAVFINLELDRRPEALRVCGVLARIAETDRDASPNAAQIKELVALTKDPAVAERYWKRQAAWWPVWLTIEHNLSGPAEDQPLVPLVPDTAAVNKRLSAAVEAQDRAQFLEAYRPLAHAARWDPKFLISVASVVDQTVQIFPQQAAQVRGLLVSALTDLDVPDNEVMLNARVDLAINLVDTNRGAEALTIIKSYLASATENDWRRQTMHRLWSWATNDPTELSAALEAMQADLDAPEGVADRPRTVTRMAEVYRQLNQRDMEIALLKKELSNPVIKADAENSRLLSARLQGLTGTPAVPNFEAPNIADALAAWLPAHKPAWYDYARPHAMKDLGGQDPNAMLKNPTTGMQPAELAKLALLVAQDPSESSDQRREAFEMMGWYMHDALRRHDQFSTLATTVFNDPKFPEQTRRYWLSLAMNDGADLPRTAMLGLHPLYAGLTAAQRQEFESSQLYGVDQDSAESLSQYIGEALGSPMDSTHLARLEKAFARLEQLSPQSARSAYDDTKRLALATGSAQTPAAVRLGLLRGLKFAERFEPAASALSVIVLEHFHLHASEPPADWFEHRDEDDLDLLDPDQQLSIRLWMVKTRRFETNYDGFWADLLNHAPPALVDLPLRTQLFRALLTELPNDDSRAGAIFVSTSFFDIDRPDQRAQLLALLIPYSDSIKYPYSSGVIRALDADIALRDGKPVDIDAALRDQKSTLPATMEVWERLTAMLEARDAAGLKRYLSAMNAAALIAPDDELLKLASLRAAGMDDEAGLLLDAMREWVYRDVLSSWAHPNAGKIRQALELAVALDDAGLIPPHWAEDCMAQVQNLELLALMRMRLAELRHDWPAVIEAADQQLAVRPTRYWLNWDKGNALFQLGKKSEAAAALGVFTRLCKDNIHCSEAVALLDKCGTR